MLYILEGPKGRKRRKGPKGKGKAEGGKGKKGEKENGRWKGECWKVLMAFPVAPHAAS